MSLSISPLSVFASAVCVLLVAVLLIRRRRYVAQFKDIPGPKGFPIIGNALEFLGTHTESFKLFFKFIDDFGDVYQLWIGTDPYVVIGSAEALQPVLSASDKIIDKSSDYDLLKKWIGDGLATSTGDYHLPEGTQIVAFLSAVHKDPKYYPDPEKFDPDRFLTENSSTRHPFSFVPFSAGSRNCIAQKYGMLVVKIILIKLLEAYEVSTSMRHADLKLRFDLVLHNEDGVKISLQKRSKQKM